MNKVLCWFVDKLYGPRDDGTRTETKDALIFVPIIPLVILSILLVSCAPPATPVPPTEIPTATIEPSPTPIVLADIDLKALAIQEGDLPAGFSIAQVTKRPPDWYGWNKGPEVESSIYITLTNESERSGEIVIVLSDDEDVRLLAYQAFQRSLGKDRKDSDKVGEIAQTMTTYLFTPIYIIAFQRCAAVVYVDMWTFESETMIYAQNLDARLTEALCP